MFYSVCMRFCFACQCCIRIDLETKGIMAMQNGFNKRRSYTAKRIQHDPIFRQVLAQHAVDKTA